MNGFKDYAQSLAVVAKFIADTRTKVAEAIMQDVFPPELIEATCMCKFVGTGFAVDAVSAMRKLMGSRVRISLFCLCVRFSLSRSLARAFSLSLSLARALSPSR